MADVARIEKAPPAFGALNTLTPSSPGAPGRPKEGKLHAGGVLAVLLYGYKSRCLAKTHFRLLKNFHINLTSGFVE